jgi:hypothetical protein
MKLLYLTKVSNFHYAVIHRKGASGLEIQISIKTSQS